MIPIKEFWGKRCLILLYRRLLLHFRKFKGSNSLEKSIITKQAVTFEIKFVNSKFQTDTKCNTSKFIS